MQLLCATGRACLLLILVVAPFAAFHAADEGDARPPGKLGDELDWVRDVLRNADAKLRGNVVGVGAPAATTPARVCCTRNLERLAESSQKLDAILARLESCYEGEEDDAMIAGVQFARLDLRELAAGVQGFAQAADGSTARAALLVVTRRYIELRDSASRLRPCGEQGRSEPEPGEAKKRKKKKKKKNEDAAPPKAPAG